LHCTLQRLQQLAVLLLLLLLLLVVLAGPVVSLKSCQSGLRKAGSADPGLE
jgi:hypothetical protein